MLLFFFRFVPEIGFLFLGTTGFLYRFIIIPVTLKIPGICFLKSVRS